MARTIQKIKDEITTEFISHDEIKEKYKIKQGDDFEKKFSKISIENILFYVVASAIWILEKLFDLHATDMEMLLETKKPHRLKWYRDKALNFQYGYNLIPDSDIYDNSKKDEDDGNDIESSKIVKFAAAVENGSEVLIKIAGETNGERNRITDEQETALAAYLNEIKDAGVFLKIVNEEADSFKAEINVYYNPMILDSKGNKIDGGEEPVRLAIEKYLVNLPFNGEYSNMALIDEIQTIKGVIIAEVKNSQYKYGTYPNFTIINDKVNPNSGYFKIYNQDPKNGDLLINYIPYENK